MDLALDLGTRAPDSDGFLSSLARFSLAFAPHLLLAPIVLFLGTTFLHELAHAAMALALGHTVTDFAFLPGASDLGHMRWEPRDGASPFDGVLVSVAPYLMWSAFAAVTLAIAALPNRLHWLFGSSLFLYGYAIPIGDIAWNLASGTGDLAVPGFEGLVVQLVGLGLVAIAWCLGHFAQRRLLGGCSVTFGGYVAATVLLGGLFGAAGVVGYVLLLGV
jgi:hypothetical protein